MRSVHASQSSLDRAAGNLGMCPLRSRSSHACADVWIGAGASAIAVTMSWTLLTSASSLRFGSGPFLVRHFQTGQANAGAGTQSFFCEAIVMVGGSELSLHEDIKRKTSRLLGPWQA